MQVYNKILDIDWKLINLINAIERFDANWAAIEKREVDGIITTVTIGEDLEELVSSKLVESKELNFWYETDIDTHPLVKTAVLFAELITKTTNEQSLLFPILLLKKSGYLWADQIKLDDAFKSSLESKNGEPGDNVTDWVMFFLKCVSQCQNTLLQVLEQSGSGSSLSPKEKIILHVIGNKTATKTAGIAKKAGVSTATAKRTLDRLITAKLIERQGNGAGSYYTLI